MYLLGFVSRDELLDVLIHCVEMLHRRLSVALINDRCQMAALQRPGTCRLLARGTVAIRTTVFV